MAAETDIYLPACRDDVLSPSKQLAKDESLPLERHIREGEGRSMQEGAEMQWGMELMEMLGWLGTQGVAGHALRPRATVGARISLFISLLTRHILTYPLRPIPMKENRAGYGWVQSIQSHVSPGARLTVCLSPGCESPLLVLLTWKLQQLK